MLKCNYEKMIWKNAFLIGFFLHRERLTFFSSSMKLFSSIKNFFFFFFSLFFNLSLYLYFYH